MVFIYGFGDLGDQILTEADAVRRSCPKSWLKPALDALASEEDQVLQATGAGQIDGLCLRFGVFYGVRITDCARDAIGNVVYQNRAVLFGKVRWGKIVFYEV
jgi:hypothetical protein